MHFKTDPSRTSTTSVRLLAGSVDLIDIECFPNMGLASRGVTMNRLVLAVLLGCALAAEIPRAGADVLQIAGPAFTGHGVPSFTPAAQGDVNQGLLLNAQGSYFAPVLFPTSGQQVCRLALVYRDNDADFDVSASLLRKPAVIGGNAFDPPITMASVSSSGADNAVRESETTVVKRRIINTGNFFYFVELHFPQATLEAIGVQVEVKPTCP